MTMRVSQVISESALFRAYGEDPAVLALRRAKRPCACKGVVEADPIDPTPGVQEHQKTPQHQAWRAWREAADE